MAISTKILLGISFSALVAGAAPMAFAQAEGGDGDDDIVVTATRRQESASKVPISMTAISGEKLDVQGVRQIDDLNRLTPGLNFTRGTGTITSTSISVRGITTGPGPSTTGIYINDVPVQTRSLGNFSNSTYPTVFDLERVEVLRGPQGTLFGASAMGGVVRFITPEPDLKEMKGYVRAEMNQVQHGGTGGEIGAALSLPLVEDKVAVRGSVYYRREAGYIDRVIGTGQVLPVSPTMPIGGFIYNYQGTNLEDANWVETLAGSLSLKLAVSDNFTVTPSIYAQRIYTPDVNQQYNVAASDPSSGVFRQPQFIPTIDARHTPSPGPGIGEPSPSTDKYWLPSLKMELDMGFATLTSNTSYFARRQLYNYDGTDSYIFLYKNLSFAEPGDRVDEPLRITQDNFVQELRLQGNSDSRFQWQGGVYYARNKQTSTQDIYANFFGSLPAYAAVVPADGYAYHHEVSTIDKEIAGFGQVSYALFDRLKLTAGVRVSHTTFNYDALYNGITNVPNRIGSSRSSANPVNPKFGIEFQADNNNLFYATVAKGYRTGGGVARVPARCDAQLKSLGYVDAAGNAASPETYEADNLWSYEAGSKNRLFGGKLSIDASAYYIKWKNIITSVSLNTCGNSIIVNAGSATSKGFDLQMQLRPVDGLTLGTNIGYTDTSYDEALVVSGRTLIAEGSGVSNAPRWTFLFNGQYDFVALDKDFYLRGDYSVSGDPRLSGNTYPGNFSYDPYQLTGDKIKQANARIGVKLGDIDASFFMNNLFDSSPVVSSFHRTGRPVYTNSTIRPRTYGVTLSSRF